MQLVWTGLVASETPADDLLALVDGGAIPPRAVLLGKQHQRAVVSNARRAARFSEEHQRQQARDLGFIGHQQSQRARQANRLGAQPAFGLAVQAGRVDQVDHRQHRAQAIGQFVLGRHPIWDARGLDLVLGPHQPLGHRRFGNQERAGDLLGRQATEQSQGERHARLWRQRRVATGEDEPNRSSCTGPSSSSGLGRWLFGHLREELTFTRFAAQPIERSVPRGRRDPGAGIGRHAIRRPPAQRNPERFLDRILGDIDVAEGTDQRGDRPARVLAKDLAEAASSTRTKAQPLGSSAKSTNGRTSIGEPMQRVTFEAQVRAASRSSASIM